MSQLGDRHKALPRHRQHGASFLSLAAETTPFNCNCSMRLVFQQSLLLLFTSANVLPALVLAGLCLASPHQLLLLVAAECNTTPVKKMSHWRSLSLTD